MKSIVWLTDLHLNFLTDAQADEFLERVAATGPDALLVGGDIAESPTICDYLERMHDVIAAPIYFVLGNHDYYFGSIVETRRRVKQFCAQRPRLRYLTCEDVAPLTAHVALVGHDGWADGRLGDYPRSLVVMHDHKLIAELSSLNKQARWEILKALGDEAASHFRRVLPLAFEKYRDVVVLTHVPPFREACWHEGRISDDQWAPHFTCQAVGQAILDCLAEHPDKRITVLCGHTHGEGETQPLGNLQVITGGAEYGRPKINRVLELD